MAKKITVNMYLNGGTQFNSEVKRINDNLKLLGSEMKQNNEIFKANQNSTEALRAKSETLNKQYEQAEKKVKQYAERLQEVQKAREKASADLTRYTELLVTVLMSLPRIKTFWVCAVSWSSLLLPMMTDRSRLLTSLLRPITTESAALFVSLLPTPATVT